MRSSAATFVNCNSSHATKRWDFVPVGTASFSISFSLLFLSPLLSLTLPYSPFLSLSLPFLFLYIYIFFIFYILFHISGGLLPMAPNANPVSKQQVIKIC